VAGFLLWQVLKDKASDREIMRQFLDEFHRTQLSIVSDVRDIAASLRELVSELDARSPAGRG
jgi:hypothetical protein